MSQSKEVVTLHLPETVASRRYPFSQQTLDQLKELRAHREAQLFAETGREHMVPAPIIIADAIHLLYTTAE